MRWSGFSLGAAVVVVPLTGCTTEYHGHDANIDGVLWRQIAAFKDPLNASLYRSFETEPERYIDALVGAPWDGAVASLPDLHLEKGGAVLYDISSTGSIVELSVFIASGPRADVPTDEGRNYYGPSEVFTCYDVEADLEDLDSASQAALEKCPATLTRLLSDDAAFASVEVLSG